MGSFLSSHEPEPSFVAQSSMEQIDHPVINELVERAAARASRAPRVDRRVTCYEPPDERAVFPNQPMVVETGYFEGLLLDHSEVGTAIEAYAERVGGLTAARLDGALRDLEHRIAAAVRARMEDAVIPDLDAALAEIGRLAEGLFGTPHAGQRVATVRDILRLVTYARDLAKREVMARADDQERNR